MNIHFIRHATFVLNINSLRFLVDPMLSHKEELDPVRNAANDRRIPLVDLPLTDEGLKQLLAEIDAVLLTHVHRDHFDNAAKSLLSKDLPVLCQPASLESLKSDAFHNLLPVEDRVDWNKARVIRTGGQHGTGEVGKRMGTASGYVIKSENQPSVYIAGDTIWCPEVSDAIDKHSPDVIVLYAGAAQFLTGGPITMTAQDIERTCRKAPDSIVVAIHMDAVNHCMLTRSGLRDYLRQKDLTHRVMIPADGEVIEIA